MKKCRVCNEKEAKPHWNNGFYCGDKYCDDCFDYMVRECKKRS